eukprot:531741-Pyramimonas_sp.AAC.1
MVNSGPQKVLVRVNVVRRRASGSAASGDRQKGRVGRVEGRGRLGTLEGLPAPSVLTLTPQPSNMWCLIRMVPM